MADIGYSPLPANLSQEIANSIGRMQGSAPEQLNAGNCANPRFRGDIGGGAPPDPLANVGDLSGGGVGGGGTGASSGNAAAGTGAAAAVGAVTSDAAAASSDELAVGGGSGKWRRAEPLAYDRPGPLSSGATGALLLLALVLVPPLVFAGVGRLRRRRA
jgi:phosphate transport system substrate-binding protein